MAAPKQTLPSRIVVPGVRKPQELGAATAIGKFWLLFGDPSDIVLYLNREGFPAHNVKLACAQTRNAILVVPTK